MTCSRRIFACASVRVRCGFMGSFLLGRAVRYPYRTLYGRVSFPAAAAPAAGLVALPATPGALREAECAAAARAPGRSPPPGVAPEGPSVRPATASAGGTLPGRGGSDGGARS